MGGHVNGSIPFVSSNGKEVTLEIFVEGDMKFLLTALGLNAANSKFPCQNCKIINIKFENEFHNFGYCVLIPTDAYF
jgi:hypothetical protein